MNVTKIALGAVNCYLIRTKAGLFLVDSGVNGTVHQLLSAIKEAGEDPKYIKLLILTHGHSDHAGNAAWLQREYEIPVAVHRLEAEYVRSASNEVPRGTSWLARLIGLLFKVLAGKREWEGFEPDHLLDGETDLDAYGLDAQLLEFPGHTAGSIGVLFSNGDLIAGDLVANLRKPSVAMFAQDLQRMKADIRGLKARGVKMLYPGHGNPFPVTALKV